MRLPSLTLALALLSTPALATDFQALRDDPEVSNGVLSYAVADFLRDNCGRIDERTVRGKVFLAGLVSRAQSLGYSFDEAAAYVDDEDEQARVQGQAMAYLRAQGLPAEPTEADWCRVGRAELAKSTPVRLMIREK